MYIGLKFSIFFRFGFKIEELNIENKKSNYKKLSPLQCYQHVMELWWETYIQQHPEAINHIHIRIRWTDIRKYVDILITAISKKWKFDIFLIKLQSRWNFRWHPVRIQVWPNHFPWVTEPPTWAPLWLEWDKTRWVKN